MQYILKCIDYAEESVNCYKLKLKLSSSWFTEIFGSIKFYDNCVAAWACQSQISIIISFKRIQVFVS